MTTAAVRLHFMSTLQEPVTVRIPRASLSLTSPQVNLSMHEMVRTQAYDTRGRGELVVPTAAQYVTLDTINFEV